VDQLFVEPEGLLGSLDEAQAHRASRIVRRVGHRAIGGRAEAEHDPHPCTVVAQASVHSVAFHRPQALRDGANLVEADFEPVGQTGLAIHPPVTGVKEVTQVVLEHVDLAPCT
jgi:hypothetical protein